MLLLAIAGYLKLLYHHFRKLEYLDERLSVCREALDMLPDDHPRTAECLRGIADTHRLLFLRTNQVEKIEVCIDLYRKAITVDNSYETQSGLGGSLRYRFVQFGNASDLYEAVKFLKQAVEGCPDDNPEKRTSILHSLGIALYQESELTADMALANKGIDLIREALSLNPRDFNTMGDLATILSAYSLQKKDINLMDEAIDFAREALSLCPEGTYNHGLRLEKLGMALCSRHALSGDPINLDEGIEFLQRSLLVIETVDRDRTSALQNLAVGLVEHARLTGNMHSLESGISHMRHALQLRLHGHPDRATTLSSLAAALTTSFIYTGNESDLEDAIQIQEEGLKLRPPGHPGRYQNLANLGLCLDARCTLNGDPLSAESAVRVLREALTFCPDGHPYHVKALQNLSLSLATLYRFSRKADSIMEAARHQEEVLKLCPIGDPQRPKLLGVSAAVLIDAYRQSQNLDQLEKAIAIERESLSLHPEGHPERGRSLINIAWGLRLRFLRKGDNRDAEDALQQAFLYLEELTPEHPDRFIGLSELARLYITRGAPYFNVKSAIGYLSASFTGSIGKPRQFVRRTTRDLNRFEKILEVGTVETKDDPRLDLLELYRHTIELLPRVASSGSLSQRLLALQDSDSLGTNAVGHALGLGRPNTAVELLEASRATFWLQALRLRTPFQDLPQHMADELSQLSQALETGSNLDRTTDPLDEVSSALGEVRSIFTFQKAADVQRRRQSARFEELIAEVRRMPDRNRFLLFELYESLQVAACKGPVVVLVANRAGCHAIIIRASSESADHVPLPGLDIDRLKKLGSEIRKSNLKYLREARDGQNSQERKSMTSRGADGTADGILMRLWFAIVKPIVDHLHLSVRCSHVFRFQLAIPSDVCDFVAQKASGRKRPRVFWCPTGAFTFVPLHAAGVATGPSRHAADYMVSSYTPTLGALMKAQSGLRSIPQAAVKTLLIAEPAAPSLPILMNTIDEIYTVAKHVPVASLLMIDGRETLQPEHGATAASVLDKLPQAAILHLACHGQQDPEDPLQSGFCLRDKTLTIAQLMQSNLSDAMFAFLSACETAKGDASQPDQTVHLAASMLFVGFRSILCTMW